MPDRAATPREKKPWPPRAVASITFAGFSIYVFLAGDRIAQRVGRLNNALQRAELAWIRKNVSTAFGRINRDLALVSAGLALAALLWCIWSWRRESGPLVGVAVLFTFLAVVLTLAMFA